MFNLESKISKKVLAWALVFTLTLSVIPTIVATHDEDNTINIENGVFPWDDDGLSNDLLFYAHTPQEDVDEILINVWKKNAIGNWDFYDDGETNESGELSFFNVTAGEYLWDAYDGNSKLENEGGFATVDSTYLVGHVGILDDIDGEDDFDDFLAYILEVNGTSDNGYVEIYDEYDNLVDEGYTDEELDDNFTAFLSTDLDMGNYTHYIFDEYNGTLLQNGSFYSYGSYNTTSTGDSDEWFEDWNYSTEDTNGDNIANEIQIKFNPDTDCNCSMNIQVDMNIYNNDTGQHADSNYSNYEINGTENDAFTFNWTADEDGNFTFEFYLYDDEWNYEDNFVFLEYLECDEDITECSVEEWFEDWDSETEDTDGDNLDDTISVSYDPNTECDCDIDIYVYMDVYENSSGDWVAYIYANHNINGSEEEYFEQSWSSHNSSLYDFYVYMVDEEGDFEDSFWIYGIYLYQTSGAGGPGDEDEYFDYADAYTYDSDNDGNDDTVEVDYDPDTTCDCNITVELVFDVYDNTTGSWINGTEENYTIYKDDDDYLSNDWSPEYNGTFDFYLYLYDEDENLEDELEYLGVELHVRSNGGGGDDNGSSDEWFEERDYDVYPSDTINIGYDPNTDCDCEVRVWTYIDVYQDGYKIDTIADDYYVYSTYYDWFEQSWTADENDTYDFYVVLFDGENGPDNFEDDFWIYDVYLSSDDGGGGNQTDDDNGVGHMGVIDNFDDDDYVNDYIGAVIENDEYKENAYFEIYDENGNLVDSGNPNYYGMLFVSSNLTEGWYYQDVYYQEDDAMLQTGLFYSYGNSTEFEVVNVDNIVIDDDEWEVYDDVGFKAHQGNFDSGVANVGIEINKYNHSTEEWDYHAYVETNETGEAWLYNEPCGEYEWVASTDDERGYYEVWAHCDDDGNGGDDNETKDYDEWFGYWDYYGPEEPEWNEIIIGYDPNTECNCTVSIYVEIYVWDENDDMVDFRHNQYNITDTYSDWFEQKYDFENPGEYSFTVDIYDAEWNHEDSFEFTLIMSDEWFESDFHQEDATVYIDLAPHTNYEGEILTHYYLEVYRLNENDEWERWDNQQVYEVFITGSNNNEYIHFEWTAEEDGQYHFEVWMEDQYWNGEYWADFEAQLNLNSAPVIEELMSNDYLYEGQMNKYEVFIMDEDADLQIHWDMGDGTTYENGGFDLFHTYHDDGIYEVTIIADDGTYNSIETFEIKVFNSNPVLVDVMFDNSGNEGDTVSFNAQVSDVPSDEVTVTWTFPDGTTVESLFSQYTFTDDGDFIVLLTASDEDGGQVSEQFTVIIENVAPIFTEFQMPSAGQEGEALDFIVDASDPGDDTVIFNIDFGDGTSPLITQDGGNISHKFAEGDTFTVKICATDEDGGETCREQILPVSILEQLEDSGLPGFNLLAVISALGIISILRRRTH